MCHHSCCSGSKCITDKNKELNMKNLFFIAFILNITLLTILVWFVAQRLRKNINSENDDYFKRIINYINSIRYGNITEKIDESNLLGTKKILAQSINRMSETLVDRENMIREYEKVMLEKNKSLEQLIKQEQDMHSLRKDFIATLGHDLKVPILAADNTLEFLLDGTFGELNSKQFEVLKKMKNSNSDLIILVENILATYKSDEQNIVLQKSMINLKSLIIDAVQELTELAQRENINIETALDDVDISVDPFQMKRVIKNLLHNAISYSLKNSSVQIILSKQDKYAIIEVVDFGVGIEEKDIAHIFEKYYSCAKKFRKVGTGLGLYLSNQIVKTHEGTIEVNSTPNEKTVFTIKLPRK